ncbi:pimeloyl-ACP methyl ester esterase BioH [Kangiella sp. TOML190]|uniref:pimeloyl-ACP methyl ester esterase BioH n=1 Tax=Kangiella sp. TOML190 TaxID=2931351 RepID=UPI00203BDB0B|nr:pimeloyl-ACP methyl ester esterase BioH [Kangiella sp. TOML190]
MSSIQPYLETHNSKKADAEDLVLLHGWGLHSGIWNLLLDELTKHCRVHLIDLPGFGRSPIPSGDYDLELLTEQVLKVAPAKAHYLGWSLGGVVATNIALTQADRVAKLITVASSPKFVQSEDWPCGMKPNIMDSFCRFLEEDYQGTIIRFLAIQAMGSETQKEDIRLLKDTVFVHGTPATKALRDGLNMLSDVDLRQGLARLTMPRLRLYGRLDTLVPNKAAQAIQDIDPQSSFKVYPKASHAPFLTNRAEFTQDLIHFLNQ